MANVRQSGEKRESFIGGINEAEIDIRIRALATHPGCDFVDIIDRRR